MTTLMLIMLGVLTVPAIMIAWVVWRFAHSDGPVDDEETNATDNQRIAQIKAAERPEGETEVRASDFSELEPRRHVRAGDVK